MIYLLERFLEQEYIINYDFTYKYKTTYNGQ